MNVIPTAIPEVLLLEPRVFGDERGFFFESFNRDAFRAATGLAVDFVQDNHSRSARGVLRGLHYQVQRQQGKLVRVVAGEIFDVAVDIRRGSPTFGHWVGMRLSAQNKYQLWIPAGFAHGFLSLEANSELLYKTSDYYAPAYERCIVWNDPQLAIEWPSNEAPILSPKDAAGVSLANAELPP